MVKAAEHLADLTSARGGALSGRALLVLQLYARGYTARQVGDFVGGEADAWGLLRSAARALGVESAAQAAVEARRRQLIL